MTRRSRAVALLAGLVAPLAALLALPPIPQDLAYHALADTRALLGIPSFLNVASNLAFLAVGGFGVAVCLRKPVPGAAASWIVFFAATALVAVGSAWYHAAPDNATLVWDRLPMTVAFMAVFAALVSEHIEPGLEKIVLPAAIAVGTGSIAWWQYAGDLRLYAWVQLAPLLTIALLLAAFPARYTHRAWLAYGLAFYLLAKAAEVGDSAVYALTANTVSGHTLKHLLAAMAPLCIALMLRARKPLDQARASAVAV